MIPDAEAGGDAGRSRRVRTRRRVFLVDDHVLLREGLRGLLDEEPDLVVCGQASRAAEAIAAISDAAPDIVLLDVSLEGPNGIELTKELASRHPSLPILVLSMHEEELYAARALRAGARGYVTKHESSQNLIAAIRKVLDGQIAVSDRFTNHVLSNLARDGNGQSKTGVDALTDRELEIFQLLGQGLDRNKVANRLRLGIRTVETHRMHIRRKLGLRSAADVARFAIHCAASARYPRPVAGTEGAVQPDGCRRRA
jgi:DNA-binding NarL/FixJ family response regulator